VEQRLKIGYVGPNEILSVFMFPAPKYPNEDHTFIKQVLCFQGLPPDTYVHHVFWDGNRQQFALVLYSEQFDIVPEAELLPIVPLNIYEAYHDTYGNIKAIAMLTRDYPDKADERKSVGSDWREKPPLF